MIQKRLESREWTARDKRSRMGRTTIDITCPFCQDVTTAYVWSLCGSGKNCACGAKFNGYGTATKLVEVKQAK